MFTSSKSVRASLKTAAKISAVYAFAITTAIACSNEKADGTKLGTAKGNVTVTDTSGTTVAPTSTALSVVKIENAVLDTDEYGGVFAAMNISAKQGTRQVDIMLYPQILPYVQDQGKKTVGSAEYTIEGVCGNSKCTKFGVMFTLTDTTNGNKLQLAQYWDLSISATIPQKELLNTAHDTVTSAYNSMSGTTIN